MTNQILLGFTLLLIGCLIAVFAFVIRRTEQFRRTLKPGDRVCLYKGSDRIDVTIRDIEDSEILVQHEDQTFEWVDIFLIHMPE